ncbi:MAG: UDP-N-acetylmuramoyl-tripeptide--D-alanyl-D-alanine ligase [Eggerthellaceae bacterium]
MKLNIALMAQYCAGELVVSGPEGAQASSPVWDSREVSEGCTFVALVGERVDGHDFLPQVIEAGAACVIISHEVPDSVLQLAREKGCAVLRVSGSGEQAITDLARGWRKHLSGTVVAVTGSSGKTTTKNLIATVLSAGMSTVATLANQNNELGVPRTLLRAEGDTRAVVVEMGMRGLGQLEELCRFVAPDMGVITNVGESHIELLGSRENIARAKCEVLQSLPVGGRAFLNVNNPYALQLMEWADAREKDLKLTLFGRKDAACEHLPEADEMVLATEVSLDEQGMPSFVLNAGGETRTCTLAMAGLHNVDNALCAAAVGLSLGMGIDEVVSALTSAESVAGRQQVHRLASGVTVVDDAYNANPDSMTASLTTFAAMQAAGRHVAVLGDMGELGSFAREGHERIGSLVASLGVDALVCVGDLSKHLASAALASGMAADAITSVSDWSEALAVTKDMIRPGDVVLVKASHSMALDNVVKGLIS